MAISYYLITALHNYVMKIFTVAMIIQEILQIIEHFSFFYRVPNNRVVIKWRQNCSILETERCAWQWDGCPRCIYLYGSEAGASPVLWATPRRHDHALDSARFRLARWVHTIRDNRALVQWSNNISILCSSDFTVVLLIESYMFLKAVRLLR